MPVNLPSHAHGQGYSDLNFFIPELRPIYTSRKVRTTPTKATLRRLELSGSD